MSRDAQREAKLVAQRLARQQAKAPPRPTGRPERRAGPLDARELEQLWEFGLSPSTRRHLAQRWSLAPDADASMVHAAMVDLDALKSIYAALQPAERAVLAIVSEQQGRARAELIRKDLLLAGLGDATDALTSLAQRGLILPIPSPAEQAMELEALEGAGLIQREVAISAALASLLTTELNADTSAIASQPAPSSVRGGAGERLVWNLMHLTAALLREPLKLNRTGVPHRRALTRAALGIVTPLDPTAPDDPSQDDHLAFLLALAQPMGLLTLKDGVISAQPREAERLFTAPPATLAAAIGQALRELSLWDEISSQRLTQRQSRTEATAKHLSQTEATGQALIGARGYIMSVLRRARLKGWVPLEAVVDLCDQLDRDYLPRVMKRLPNMIAPRDFIRAFLLGPLRWVGALEVSEGEGALVCFTPRGVDMLGMEGQGQTPPVPARCLIAQPNLEVVVFLDGATPTALWRMYQLGQRTALADRVATFTITAESIQRGYSHGSSAAAALAFLESASIAPVDPTLRFQLEDWERRWRRITVYADGTLLRHEDPDQLDLVLDQLRHGNTGLEILRLGPTGAYLFGLLPAQAARIFTMERGVVIDYLGDPPPCLHFEGPLELSHHPLFIDLQSRAELERWCVSLRDASGPQEVRWRIDLGMVRSRWPDDPLNELLAFLKPRAAGGLPASHELFLRSQLAPAPRAHLIEAALILTFDDEAIADLFTQIPEIAPRVISRIGATSVCVHTNDRATVHAALERAGIKLRAEPRK